MMRTDIEVIPLALSVMFFAAALYRFYSVPDDQAITAWQTNQIITGVVFGVISLIVYASMADLSAWWDGIKLICSLIGGPVFALLPLAWHRDAKRFYLAGMVCWPIAIIFLYLTY